MSLAGDLVAAILGQCFPRHLSGCSAAVVTGHCWWAVLVGGAGGECPESAPRDLASQNP